MTDTSGVAISALANVLKKAYSEKKIERAYVDEIGPVYDMYQGAPGVRTSEGQLQFAIQTADAGSIGTTGESGTLRGFGTDETVLAPAFQNFTIKPRHKYGTISATHASLVKVRDQWSFNAMLNVISTQMEGHLRMWAHQFQVSALLGGSGFVFLLPSTGGIASEVSSGGQYEYTVTIDTDPGSSSGVNTYGRMFATNAYTLPPNTPIQVATHSNGTVVTDAGYSTVSYGYVKTVLSDSSFIIRMLANRRLTVANYNNNHCIMLRRDSTEDYEPFGLYDIVGDTTNLLGSTGGANTFPYGTGVTGIDPDTYGEWNSVIVDGSSYGNVVDAMDAWWKAAKKKGVRRDQPYMYLVSPDVAIKYTKEQKADIQWRAGDVQDLRPQGYMVAHDGKPMVECHVVPARTIYIVNVSHLCIDEEAKKGPMPVMGFDDWPRQIVTNTNGLNISWYLFYNACCSRRDLHGAIEQVPIS